MNPLSVHTLERVTHGSQHCRDLIGHAERHRCVAAVLSAQNAAAAANTALNVGRSGAVTSN
jgi:hypothetical protein